MVYQSRSRTPAGMAFGPLLYGSHPLYAAKRSIYLEMSHNVSYVTRLPVYYQRLDRLTAIIRPCYRVHHYM
jgi:hypothetical protein